MLDNTEDPGDQKQCNDDDRDDHQNAEGLHNQGEQGEVGNNIQSL